MSLWTKVRNNVEGAVGSFTGTSNTGLWAKGASQTPGALLGAAAGAYYTGGANLASQFASGDYLGAATPVTTSRYVFTNKDKVTIPPVTDGKVGFFALAVEFNEAGAQSVVGMVSMRRYVNYTGYFDPLK